MQPFVLNRHDRIVFPSNFVPELDLSVIDSLDQLDSVIRRDFETKAPTGTDILRRVEEGSYGSRYELMRDIALNMFWAGRYALTMYEKRPTRWRDVPRRRNDVFLPILTPWRDGERKVAAVKTPTTHCPRPGMPTSRTGSSQSSSTCSGTASTTPPSCRRSSRRSRTSSPTRTT